MKDFLVVGDLQMKRENLPECELLFAKLETMPINPDVDAVIWLGDMLDRRGLVEAECLNRLFDYFSSSKLQHNIIVGNHDLLSLHTLSHALQPLKALKNVTIIDSPQVLFGPVGVIPYTRKPQTFIDAIAELRNNNCEYLFCHQGIKEFTLGSGYTEDEAVGLDDVKDYKMVIAGHYHTPMERGNTVYLGSPFSHSFGESNENKRLGIFHTASGTIEYIQLDIFRKHRTYEISANEPFPVLNLQDLNRIIVTGTEEEIKRVQASTVDRRGVKIIYKITGTGAAPISESLSNKDKWIKWCREIKKLDEVYVNVGLELLND